MTPQNHSPATVTVQPVTIQMLSRLARAFQREAAWIRYMETHLRRRKAQLFLAEQAEQMTGFIALRLGYLGRSRTTSVLKRVALRLLDSGEADPDSIIVPKRLARVQEIFVKPDRRRQGVASSLLQQSIRWLQTQQIDDLRAAVRPIDRPGLAFFESQGCVPRQALFRAGAFSGEQPALQPVRLATEVDLPHLVHLFRREIEYQQQLSDGFFELRPAVDWRRYVAAKLRHRRWRMWVVEQEDQLVGFSLVRIVHPNETSIKGQLKTLVKTVWSPSGQSGGRYGLIEDIYVVPAARRRGLATALMQQSLRWLQAQQVSEVQAAIWQNNTPSLSLFRGLNFEPYQLILRKKL